MKIDPKRVIVFLEFLILGTLMGVVEDVLAIMFATECSVTFDSIGVVVLIAIPFAFIGELVINRVDFLALFKKIKQ